MARRKVTFVYDPAERYGPNSAPLCVPEEMVRDMRGIDPATVTVEDLPEPPVRQRFIAEYFGRPGVGPLSANAVRARLREELHQDGTWAVTEVADA